MTNIIVLLASGLVALAAHHGLDRTVLPIAIAVTVLGIYGFLVSLKYNERARSDADRSHELLQRLDELDPELKLYDGHERAQTRKRRDFPVSGRLNLSHIWIFLNVIIIVGGASMTAACWRP
jgi:hypothetical protein